MIVETFDAVRLGDIRVERIEAARCRRTEPIVEHPDWTYRRIAEEANARIGGAKASEKSVRWYASRMRKTR